MTQRSKELDELVRIIGDPAAKIQRLHLTAVNGTFRTWVPLQPEGVRASMLDQLAEVITACARAQQHLITMGAENLPTAILQKDLVAGAHGHRTIRNDPA